MEYTYYNSNNLWFIKVDGQISGGRYDTEATAKYAAEKLTLDQMDQVWLEKYKDSTRETLSTGLDPSVVISTPDIEAYLEMIKAVNDATAS